MYSEVQRQIHVSKISPKKAKSYPDSNQLERRKRDKRDREIKKRQIDKERDRETKRGTRGTQTDRKRVAERDRAMGRYKDKYIQPKISPKKG